MLVDDLSWKMSFRMVWPYFWLGSFIEEQKLLKLHPPALVPTYQIKKSAFNNCFHVIFTKDFGLLAIFKEA